MGRQHVNAIARGLVVRRQQRRAPHAHRATYTTVIDADTVREKCYCYAVRFVTRGTPSPWHYQERQPRDVAPVIPVELRKLHREMLVAALAYGHLCASAPHHVDISAAARELERAAARWAIGLGKVGRAAKAR